MSQLAKVRFDKARVLLATSHPEVKIVVRYHPFQIDPATHADGEEYSAYCKRRWGGDGWTRSMRQMGKREGADYAKWVTWPNSAHCHSRPSRLPTLPFSEVGAPF